MELKTIAFLSDLWDPNIFQDGGQVLGVLRMTLAIVQVPPEHEFTTATTPLAREGDCV